MPFNKTETLLIFRIADIPFAVPAESVGSILMPPAHITRTPGSGRSNPGIFHHAQFTYAVIDLHQRFGFGDPRTGIGRLLLQEEGIRHYAFLVDEVVGLVRSELGKWANLPHYLPRQLFPTGFLHRDEIVLCSELYLLRNMHDVGPLRRHFAQLQQQQSDRIRDRTEYNAPSDIATKTETITPPERKSTLSEETTATITPTPPPSVDIPPETAVMQHNITNTRPTPEKPAIPTEVKPATPAPAKPSFSKSTASKPRHVAAAIPGRDSARESKQPKTTTSAAPPVAHTTATRYKVEPIGRDYSILLLFLLLLGVIPLGYWLWPEPQRNNLQMPVTVTSSPLVAESDAPVSPASEPPLRIERDDEGTINLIIDREAAENAGARRAQNQGVSTAANESVTETKTMHETISAQPNSATGEQPTTGRPEPCDCTHIVVRGDTLWDIAEKYTGNAFSYPDLAKRSGIKNPHRIYPGDKVRIIIR